MDRHPPDVSTECVLDRVAHGGIHLARDLRDGHTERDGQVKLEVDRVSKAE